MMRSIVLSSSTLSLALIAVAHGQIGTSGQLDEIVVTATKREEKLVNVPTTIDVVSAATIDKLGIVGIDDYLGLIPNVAQYSLGTPGNSTIVIRGMFTGSASLTSTTAYYLDEAALTASGFVSTATYISPDVGLADVDHIEVLKGPQSTLYGANALGGVLRIITKKPDPTAVSGSAGTDFSTVDGGGEGYGVHGSINLPLIEDKAAVRINLFKRQDPGYYDNLGTGRKNTNEAQIEGGRIAFRFLPTDRLAIDLNALYQSIDATSAGFEQDNQVTLTPAFGAYNYSSAENLRSTTYYRTVGATVAYKFDNGTLTATSGYAKYGTAVLSDTSAVYAPFVASFAEPGASIFLTSDVQSTKETEEVHFASNRLGHFEYVLGGFFTHEDDLFQTDAPIINPDGSTPAAFGGVLILSPNPATYREYAGFGDLTYYITDSLDVTGGFRYGENKQYVDSMTYGFFSLFFPNATYNFNDNDKNYLATLRWRPNETTNFYLRAASGYRPGGPNIGATSYPPALADTVWSYEGGVKGNLPGEKWFYEFSVYHVNWDHVQLPGVDPKTSSQITTNGGTAHVDGAELELTVRPGPGLSVTGALGFNRAKLVSVAPDVTAVIGATAGDPLPLTPRWTASLTADYIIPLGGRADGDIGVTYQGLGGRRNSSYPADPTSGNVDLPGYQTVDLRCGVTVDKRYRFMVRVANLNNSDGILSYSTTRLFAAEPGVYSDAVRIRPRTYAASAAVDF